MSLSLAQFGAAVLGGVMCLAAGAAAQSQIGLHLGHGAAPGNPRSLAADKFAEIVKAKSNGRITIQVSGNSKAGDDLAMVAAIRAGTLDFSINTQGVVATVVPELSAIGLPYLFSSAEKALELLDGPIGQELAQKFEPKNMVLIAWMSNGVRQVTNNRQPITKPSDLKGLRIRTPADKATMDLFMALEANAMPINFSDVPEALKTGYVDGQENPLANIYSSKLHEVQKYISITNHKFESTPFIMSSISWGKLSADDRKLIKEAAQEATVLQRKLMAESDIRLLAEYKSMSSVKVNIPDPAPFKEATQKVWDNWELKPFGVFVKKLRAASK